MDRRTFLRAAAAGMLVAVTSAACGDDGADDRELAEPALIGMFGKRRVRALGARYRQMIPGESDAQTLRTAIANGDRRGFRLPWVKRVSVAERITDDFVAGRTVLVDGWVLSRTEVRQCALLAALSA